MTVATFDTLRAAKRLKEAGFDERQAETVTDVLRENRDADLSQLATKQDLHQETALLRQDIDQRFALLDKRLENLEQRMTIKLGGLMVVAVGAVAALVKLL